MSDPFFGDWVPQGNKSQMSQGARDFMNGKSLNAPTNKNHDELIQDFQDKKKAFLNLL